ncbi:hypothetical protein B6D29_03440 [Microgenomates bacterium UTCPR1]|nr:glycosyltransferase family 2 protein [Patescibacteria group bacterium]OQY65856.1 MAG: hypothetical protein B6D29_03440 [Microgenomates bacterium UTCPR1]
MENISAVIVVKDNPPFLQKVIDSVIDFVTEIVIVDIGISPELIGILKKIRKVKLVKVDRQVPYVEIIREKTKDFVKSDYVFFLDPDEIVTPKLKTIIKSHLVSYDFFKIPRKNIIFGRWIKHSRWWPDYQVRLFKKNKVKWPKIIHRQPKVSGHGFEVEAKEEFALVHHNYRDIDEFLSKAKRYAKYEAQEFVDEKKEYGFSITIKRSLNEFISRYFAAKGYKDGKQGFVLAMLQMIYYFFVYFYYLEMKKFKTEEKIDEADFFKNGLKEVLSWKPKTTLKEKLIKKLL